LEDDYLIDRVATREFTVRIIYGYDLLSFNNKINQRFDLKYLDLKSVNLNS
jgi:hypothetical protein